MIQIEGRYIQRNRKGFVLFRSLLASIVVLGAVVLSSAAAASTDSATSPTGAFSVSVSYPDVIVVGTSATASESLLNNAATAKTFTLSNTLTGSNGKTLTQTQVVTVAAGATFTQTFSKKANRSDVGSYTLTFTADDGSETATATAHYTVVRQ